MTTGKEHEPRVNGEITTAIVRLIDNEGKLIGDIHVREALRKAEEVSLDLVELGPGSKPPVCKILDYGKFRYEAQKKAKEARKHQKVIQIKEIKLRPTIGQHDYDVKLRSARKFIEDGDKVKLTLRFRGREMAHEELGFALLRRVAADLADVVAIESEPRLESRQIVMMLGPK